MPIWSAGGVAAGAFEDAKASMFSDIDGNLQSANNDLGIDRPRMGARRPSRVNRFLRRVHIAAGSGAGAFRLACAYVAARRKRRVLVVAADLADGVPNLAGAIDQLTIRSPNVR